MSQIRAIQRNVSRRSVTRSNDLAPFKLTSFGTLTAAIKAFAAQFFVKIQFS